MTTPESDPASTPPREAADGEPEVNGKAVSTYLSVAVPQFLVAGVALYFGLVGTEMIGIVCGLGAAAIFGFLALKSVFVVWRHGRVQDRPLYRKAVLQGFVFSALLAGIVALSVGLAYLATLVIE